MTLIAEEFPFGLVSPVYLPRSVIHNGYSASWNAKSAERVNHHEWEGFST